MIHLLAKLIQKKMAKDYNAIASDFSKTRERKWPDLELISQYFEKSDNVLDIGCGDGRLITYIKYKTFSGIDISSKMIEIAHSKKLKNTFFELGSFTELPNHTYDKIVSIAAFHHLASSRQRNEALRNMYAHLHTHGKLIISIWNIRYIESFEKIRRISAFLSKITCGLISKHDLWIPWKLGEKKRYRYYYAFEIEEMKKLLKNTGFKVTSVLSLNAGKKVIVEKAHNIYFICTK